MVGCIVRHGSHLGKILNIGKRSVKILYLVGHPVEKEVSRELFEKRIIKHTQLTPGLQCKINGGECCIVCKEKGVLNESPLVYRVQYGNGLSDTVSEVDLTPIVSERMDDPLSLLASLNPQGYPLFESRERLAEAFHRLTREGSGFRALLSSRIDLLPHQAFVAGVVLMDVRKRYILADEVGLGKTIEAGIIIHDLLSQKSDAKVLIICPSSLVQQWLCEIYSKFGGQIFRLIDIRTSERDPLHGANRVIISTNLAVSRFPEELAKIKWDLVVIDEVHHLLASPALHGFVSALAAAVPSLLLLSAIPAQKREDEFLRLLALLEPGCYMPDDPAQREGFRALHALQTVIGRRTRILARRIDELENGGCGGEQVLEVLKRLLDMEVLREDRQLLTMLESLSADPSDLIGNARKILRTIADRYRINRRILRNRRQHLIEEGQIRPIQRKCVPRPYRPDQLEMDCVDSVEILLGEAGRKGLGTSVLLPLSRILLQSLASPISVTDLLRRLDQSRPSKAEEDLWDPLISGELTGYTEWETYWEHLCSSARPYIGQDSLDQARERALLWANYSGGLKRLRELMIYLGPKLKETPPPKIIVFAGFPGIAAWLAQELSRSFGEETTTVFLNDLTREQKEENVLSFQADPRIFFMVSDETGGEGRNFQFASEIIHFDLPWYVGRIEQRIGRIDRLGRENVRDDAVSVVIFNDDSVEAGLYQCYNAGFQVFTRSISGLEFALRELEQQIVEKAIEGGRDRLLGYVEDLAVAAEQERALDESESLTDLASFDRTAVERFKKVFQSEDSESLLESSFLDYFRMIATTRSVVEVGDSLIPRGIWQFTLDNTLYGILALEDKTGEGLFGTCRGTFRRQIARQAPLLDFFNIGNPFFDAVISSLGLQSTGRVYAIDCKIQNPGRWAGFEFVFSTKVNLEDIRQCWGIANQARSVFTVMPHHLFVRIDGKAERSDALLKVRRSLRLPEKGRTWWNLTKDSSTVLSDLAPGGDWQTALYSAFEKAQKEATEHFEARLDREIKNELRRLQEIERNIGERMGERGKEEIEAIRHLMEIIKGWRVELDSLGFMGVNLGLREA